MDEIKNRRPLSVRDSALAKKTAHWLSQKNITPNQISIISIFFAAAAAICLLWIPQTSGDMAWIVPVLAALFIQTRLLCNLFDGMVAVEGGKKTRSGELFNDIPDRIADPLILVSAGYAISIVSWGGALGWCAGLLAILTAYVRTLSASIGAPVNFQGPMAKQHRMALMTAACLFAAAEAYFGLTGYAFFIALIVIIFGSMLTAYRRTMTAYRFLESDQHV
ncbi:MAG: CDP-alcohol phosphatidyltransferase family protein [Pseudomonadota bacterium]